MMISQRSIFCLSLVTAGIQEVEIWTFVKVTGPCDNDITSTWERVLSAIDLLEQLYLLSKFGDRSPSGKYITAKWNWNFLSYLLAQKVCEFVKSVRKLVKEGGLYVLRQKHFS